MTSPESAKKKNDPLSILQVFDRLEVGPVKLEPCRITAPYKLIQKGKEDGIDLVYSYEEDVFDPSDLASQNLASMIATQVALNYGLFFRSIVFNGPFQPSYGASPPVDFNQSHRPS